MLNRNKEVQVSDTREGDSSIDVGSIKNLGKQKMLSDINLRGSEKTPAVGGESGRIHPHKFAMWVAIASIIMMFAGLTSAYIVKSGQANWEGVRTPTVFWFSTATMLVSSLTIQAALRAFKQRAMKQFRSLFVLTLLLGIVFVILQWMGFSWLWKHGVRFEGAGAGQFLYIIFGLHALHVLGGVIALTVITAKQYFSNTRNYNSTPIEVMSTYWHFVDVLWLYLIVFFIWIG